MILSGGNGNNARYDIMAKVTPVGYVRHTLEIPEEITDLSNVPTAELQAELSLREGVKSYVFGPEDNVLIADGNGVLLDDNGPIIVTINVD